MAFELKFPASGAMSFSDVYSKLNTDGSLRNMANAIGLSVPDVFPDDFYGVKYLGFNSSGETRPSSAGGFNLPFTAFGSWTISEAESWMSLSSGSGSNSGSVTVTLTANGGSERQGTITLTAHGENVDYLVTQEENVGPPDNITLTYGNQNPAFACSHVNPTTYWIPNGESWNSATKLWADSGGTSPASTGYYSNGFSVRYWNKTTGNFESTALCM